MKELRSLIPGLLVVGLAACGDGSSNAHTVATVDTVGGVERLTYPAAPAGALDWQLDTVAVLGDAFAEDAYQFDQVSDGALASDAAGNIYVLDRQGKRVLKYGPDGRHLATFGREGEGPGELNQPMAMALGPGDTIWVSDFSNTRVTGFPQEGGDPVTIPLPTENVIPGQRLAVLDDGFLTTMNQLIMFRPGAGGGVVADRGDSEDGDGVRKVPLMHLNRSLEPMDTVWASVEPPRDMVQLQAGGSVMITMMAREFYPDFMWDDFPGSGIVVSDSAAYALHLIGPDGEMTRSIRRQPAPRTTTEQDREFARERVREESGSGGGVRVGGGGPDDGVQAEILRQRLEKMTFADLVPRVAELRVDPAGRIWVGISEDRPGEVDRIDLYDRDGTLLGELRDVPFPDVFLSPDRIGVLRRDEVDVQQLVVLDIQGDTQTTAG